MFDYKNIFASKTVLSQIIGGLAGVGALWGLNLSGEEQAAVVSLIIALQSVAGIVFRVMANKKIG